MADVPGDAAGRSVAIVGLACRFPDADDPPALLDLVLTGRRAFRRLPPCRLDLADYYSADLATPDATYSTRAALIEGWQFDRSAFRVSAAAYQAADPAHWLALETVARALAAAGFPGGKGLARNRVGVVIGNTLTGDVSRASAMRLRWPYVRRTLADAMIASGVPREQGLPVLRHAAARYLAPFPEVTADTLAGSIPASIAARICAYFGFRGGGHVVDGASSSSLLAVASACNALCADDLDVALAGGVDVSLDPFELVGLAKTGVLAAGDVRVYDESPTGFLPGEGCGVVVLMRAADARAAKLPVYAEIAGWGMSSSGHAGMTVADSGSQLLALRRAYQRANIDPSDVQLIEGHGSGTAADDLAELTALAELRKGTRRAAAVGSIKANIGHAKAAAGAAGLIKTVLAMSGDVVPPATGVRTPHPLLQASGASLRLPGEPAPWPDGPRIAGVSAMDPSGVNVHLVLSNEPVQAARHDRVLRVLPRPRRPVTGGVVGQAATAQRPAGAMRTAACLPQAPDTAVYLLQAPDRASLTARLARLADVAPWLSDAELHDLACQLAREASGNEQVRVAVVASRQEQLARLAGEATMLLPDLAAGALAIRPGIFAADGAAGRVTLLLSDGSAGMASRHEQPADAAGQPSADATGQPPADTAGQPPADAAGQLPSLAWLAWLDQVGVRVGTAVGRGLGEIAGLVWAGCLPEAEATRLARRCGEILSRPCGCAAAQEERSAQLRALLTQFVFTGPRRRLISAATGRALISASDIVEALCAQLGSQDRLEEALRAGAADADLLIEAGPGESLSAAAARFGQVPAISLVAGAGHDRAAAGAVAALFAVGVLGRPRALHAGQAARPIDIWRERIFIASPCQAPSPGPAGSSPGTPQAGMRPGGTPQAGRLPGTTPSAAAAPMAGRALPTAADAKWVPAATPAAAPATAGPGAGRAGSQERHADLEAGPAEPAPRSPGPTLQPPRPGGDRPAAGPSSAPDPAAGPGSAPGPAAPDDDPVAGIGPWTRCFAEQLQPPRQPVIPGDDKLWRVTVAPNHPLRKLVDDLFPDEPGAGRALAVIGDPDDPDACAAALSAAADAISTGQLVVISNGPAFSGFWASLHAEHPFLGITLLRVPEGAEGLRAARRYAASGPGQFRELVIDATGQPREPVVAPVELSGGGAFPLGRTDVVLVSRGANGAGLALAQVIACCGAPVAVVGRAGPDEDSEVMNGLEQLRWAGARIAYEAVDVADPADMAAALERIERMFGPVTAIAHAIKAGRPRLVSELTETELCAHVAAESAGLRNLVSSIRTDRLRLIVTFGSVAGRHGMAGRSLLALSSGHLAARAQRLSDAIGGCQALHVDWPGWSGAGLGEPADLATGLARAGIMPIPVSEGSRMLLRMLTTPELPARVAVHGRIGVPAPSAVGHAAPQPPAAAAKHGRFVEVMRVHYPGVELVCEARLSLRADPYLADHQVDGIPVLPAAMALEAMAQAATALAGRPVRRATGVSMIAPVVVPANDPDSQAVIRICALRDGDTVRTAVRCADSGFVVDHFLATFRDHPDEPGMAGLPSEPGEPTFAESPATHVGSAGITDGTELYGPVFFQSGRFQRVAFLPEVTSRTCRALARGGDDQPWFGSAVDLAGGPLVLGSPGLNDAALQVPQACVPHRRLLVAGCEAVSFSGRETDGAVEIRAVAVTPAGRLAHESPAAADRAAGDRAAGDRAAGDRAAGDHAAGKPAAAQAEAPACNAAPSSPQPVPQPRSAGRPVAQALALPAEYAWDVEAVDAAGNLLASWRGLRMIDAGPLPRRAAWPPSLLSVYLERSAASRGLGDGIRVSVQCGQPESALAPSPVVAVVPRPAQSPDEAARPASPGSGTAASRGSGAAASRGSGAAAISSGSGCLGGFTLRIEAGDSAVCSWHAADPAQAGPAADPRLAGLRAELARRFGEPLATLNARLRAIAACLPAPDPPASHLVIDEPAGEGWVVLRAGDAVIACTAAKISGVPLPVAIAMATGGSGGDAGAAGERDQRSGEPDRRPAERDRRPAERGRQRGNPAGTGVRTR